MAGACELYLGGHEVPFENLKEEFAHAGRDGLVYRSVPFWIWNGDLKPEELRRQIREFKDVGLAGFFMHARTAGLITPYMGEEWMECVGASIEEARKLGIYPWLYDEYGFPSGKAGGRVPEAGEEYQRKVLCCSEERPGDFRWRPNTVAAFGARRNGDGFEDLHLLPDEGSARSLPEDMIVLHFYYQVRGYLDVLSRKAVRRFIELTHERYYEAFGDKFGAEIPGIFTDEPSYGLLPWSFELPERFKRRNGYDICKVLPTLFYRVEGYERARYDFWRTVLEMFVEAYMKQIYEWCSEHGIALTGHIAWAETLMGQMTFHGASMPHYEFMHIPGTNHLGVRLMDCTREKQVVSIARQLGRRRVLCEIAGGMGWGVKFEDIKWVTEWQLSLGINLLCQHMHHYTLHGPAKRDIPPSYSHQQPWWREYKLLNDYFARLIFMLTRGERRADVLMIHPIRSAWILFDGKEISGPVDTHGGKELVDYNARQAEIANSMLSIHRDFDYGDEGIISRYGKVEWDNFLVGNAAYRVVVLPELISIDKRTLELLKEFMENGGKVVCIGEPPEMVEGVRSEEPRKVLSKAYSFELPSWPPDFKRAGRHDQPKTWEGTRRVLKRELDGVLEPSVEVKDPEGEEVEHIYCHERDLGQGRRILFLVNISRDRSVDATVRIRAEGAVERWDPETGEVAELPARRDGEYLVVPLSFLPTQSHLLLVDPASCRGAALLRPPEEETMGTKELSGDWLLRRSDPNALTLDRCRWALDGGELSEPQPTLKVRMELEEHTRNPDEEPQLVLEYCFEVDPSASVDLSGTTLVLEAPELFSIYVNGQRVSSEDTGWWRDIAFRKVPIGKFVRPGRNVVRLEGKLTPRTEIESIYILGDFGVRSLSPFREGDRNTLLTEGPFAICDEEPKIRNHNLPGGTDITSQGYWFYAGNVRLSQRVELPSEWFGEGKRVLLELEPPYAVLVRAFANGKDVGVRAWRPYRFDLTESLRPGENEIALELFGSCRNLLGPHHHWRGEVVYAGTAFGLKKSPDEDEPEVPEHTWVDRYCFVKFGLKGVPVLRCVMEI